MASINYQYELIKMYLAAFIRPPEKSGLEYWLLQLDSGKSFDNVLETVFSLDIVKDVYPTALPPESFVTLIYVNVFGKSPDLEGLNYWKQQMLDGRSRGNLVMDMINAGLTSQDGTEGKAYIINRLAVAQFAVDQQFAQRADLTPNYLKNVMLSVNANPDTVTAANKLLGSSVTGVGLGAPVNAMTIVAAADGLSTTEVNAGVAVVVDLTGTNAVANNVLELLLDNRPFSTPITRALTDAEVKAKKVSLVIPKTVNWGNDGTKLLTVFLKDSVGNVSPPGGDIKVDLNIVAPKAPMYALSVPAAADRINLVEKTSGVAVGVTILGTGAVVGDKLELLLNSQSFTQKVLATITSADVESGTVNMLIPGSVNWNLDGDKLLSARILDRAGNIGGSGGTVVVNIDTTAPVALLNAVQIASATNGLNYLERASPVRVKVDLTGINATLGDSVELLIDDKAFASSTLQELSAADILAKFVMVSIAPLDPAWNLAEGNRSISARLIDSAGNVGKSGGNLTVLVDSIAPKTETTSFTIAAATDGISAAEKNAGVSIVVNLVGSGVVAGDTITILSGLQSQSVLFSQVLTAAHVSAKQVTLTVPASSNWGSDGNKVLAVSFTDVAGNVSIASPSSVVILDTQAPSASTVDLQVPARLNGINTLEKVAGVLVNVSLAGTQAVVKDKVEILLAGSAFATPVTYVLTAADIANNLVSVLIPGNAAWGADGNKQISARVVDVAGNIGAPGIVLDVLIDTIAPDGPSSVLVVPANEGGGISIAEKNQGVMVKVSLGGTNVQIGDRVELLIGGLGFANPVTAILTDSDLAAKAVFLNVRPSDGWGSDGDKVLSARFIDFAGNLGVASGNVTVTLDSVAPNPTEVVLSIPAAQNGINSAEKAAGFDVFVDLRGTGAISGDIIQLYLDEKPFATPITLTLTGAEATAKQATIKVPANVDLGADGNHLFSVVITDGAGNSGRAGGSLVVVVDTAGPSGATVPLVIPAASNGISSAEKLAGVVVQADLTGTGAKVSDKFEILINGASFKSTIMQTLSSSDIGAGSLSITIPGNADWGTDGLKNMSFRLIDAAGNVGASGGLLVVNLDTQSLSGPSNPLVIPANVDGGISLSEKNAGVNVIVNLSGTSVIAGDSVELLIGGSAFATPIKRVITAAEVTAKTLTMTIGATDGWGADGPKNLTARFIDIAGNIGSGSGLAAVNLDTNSLNPAISPLVVAAAANGISNAEKSAGVDVIVNLDGTGAVNGDKLQILIDGAAFPTPAIYTITAAQALAKFATIKIPGNAVWGVDGAHVLSVNLIDKSGNVSLSGGDVIVVLDTTAPIAPTVPISIPAAINGLNNQERAAGGSVVVSLAGMGVVAGDTIELLLDGKAFSTNTSQNLTNTDIINGFATLFISPTTNWGVDGLKNVSARVTDIAGNVGASGGNLIITLDTSAPAGPTNPLVVPANAGGGITTTELNSGIDVVVNLNGTKAAADDTVEILLAGNAFNIPVTRVLTAADITAKTVTLTIPVGSGWGNDGIKALTARFVDSAGNLGTGSGLVNILIDGVPPNPTGQLLVVPAATNGISNAERLAGVSVVVDLNGTGALSGDTITILIDGLGFATPVTHKITAAQITAKLATVLIPATAQWGVDGTKVLSATITDALGNVSTTGGDVSVVLDTTGPTPATNAVAIVAAVNGISTAEKAAGVSVSVNLSGSNAVAGDRLDLLIDGLVFTSPVSYVLTAADMLAGVVNINIPSAAGWGIDGVKLISARFVDVAGNIGVGGVATSVVLDTTAPAGPTSTLVVSANSGGGITTAEKNAGVDVLVNLNGTTVVAGDMVEILIGGSAFANPVSRVLTAAEVTAKSVNLTIGASDGWGADGTKILTARFADIAGNLGNASGALTVTVDGGAPNPPATPLVVAAATNGISNAEKLSGVTVVVSLVGTGAVAGDTINLQLNTAAFPTPVVHTITASQITAQSATVIIPGAAVWGSDGSKLMTASFSDALGNVGSAGGDLIVMLDTTGPSAPVNPVIIAAATNGIGLTEKNAGVGVSVDLTGSGLVAGDSVELLLNNFAFPTAVSRLLTALDVSNGVVNLTIPGAANWGADGSKVISARGIDIAGNPGVGGGDLTLNLDTTAPNGPTNALVVAADGGGGITAAEKNAGVLVDVNLLGAGLVVGDSVELLIGGAAFATPVIRILNASDISANLAILSIAAGDGWGADGSKTLTARFIDQAGNVGAGAGAATVLMLDTTPPNVPNVAMAVAAAVNGINVSEKNAGVSVLANLIGTNAAAGDVATLRIDGAGFSIPVTHTITAGEVSAGNFNFVVGSGDGWGGDGSKVLSMIITDVAGNTGLPGGHVTVVLDTTLPNAPSTAVMVAAAANGINATEKTLGVSVIVDLMGTNAVVGDKVEILLGGVSFSTPVLHTLSGSDITGLSASVFIDSTSGWGADGVKTLSARIIDAAGNTGLAGGSLTTFLETSIPTAVGLPVYTDVDGLGTINQWDTYVFTISEATNKSITINDILVNNSHSFGSGASVSWSADGTQLTLTLGASTTIASGDIVTLVGVSDLAGNALNLAFSI
ncbi:DUF4214 domain-containing protein [Undibacterium seohonense]|uniref:DUF4214 domain-containing protein n=1 Tax=Undibacterium seohonense TaxID=1344950 RepID=A0ABR6X382_9BURK|nr:DUF4214 domain-containing protein [Undibacterium seohonense]MBC3807408.1 DUF4214 domain-containing protein [Undibacterium seohonense]